jgi:two-component system OmpR family sensor kinase
VTAAGERWRTYALVDVGRAVQVSQRAAVREELALNAALPAVIPSLVLIPLCWLLVRWLVGRILRPLDELAAQLAARGPESTDALTAAEVPEEIAPLVAAVNAAFGRLGHAMALQRQFVSDAAHQLRTPLTALRLQLENVKRSPNADVSDVLADMDSGLRRMSALTGQLLALARAQAAPEPAASEPISLGQIAREAVSSVLPLAHSRGVVVEISFGSDIHVLAGRGELVVMVLNILDNAVRYTGRGGRVEIDFRREERGALIEVTDTGPGLPEDMLERVFERFVRHNDDEHGTGLGLAIAKAIADRIGARITLRNREQGTGLSALVAFPSGSTRE